MPKTVVTTPNPAMIPPVATVTTPNGAPATVAISPAPRVMIATPPTVVTTPMPETTTNFEVSKKQLLTASRAYVIADDAAAVSFPLPSSLRACGAISGRVAVSEHGGSKADHACEKHEPQTRE